MDDAARRGLVAVGLVAAVIALSWLIGGALRTTSGPAVVSEPLPSVSPLPEPDAPDDCPHPALCVRWSTIFGAGSPSVVLVADGRVYARIEARTGQVRVLDPETGDRLGVFDLVGTTPAPAPAVALLATLAPPQLHGVGPEGVAWRIDVAGVGATRLTADGDVAYVATNAGELWAVRIADGEVLWTRDPGHGALGFPAVAGEAVVVAGADRTVTGVDPATGEELWTTRVSGLRFLVRPGAADEVAVLVDGSGITALDATAGEERWRAELEWGRLSPSVNGGRAHVVGRNAGRVWALDVGDGSIVWETEDVEGAAFPPVVVGDVVYVAGADRRVHALDAATGELLGSTAIDATVNAQPLRAGDVLLVPTVRGIVALGGF
ncbi:MAG: PQQ-binding-like beta-propeller repeat protein [Nitriliruptorales bacterium]